jgi:hypothetical protein
MKPALYIQSSFPLIGTAVCGAVILLSITPLFREASPGYNKKLESTTITTTKTTETVQRNYENNDIDTIHLHNIRC